MRPYGGNFIRCVTNPLVVRQHVPAPIAHHGKPLFIWSIVCEVFMMCFHKDARCRKRLRESFPEVAIGEEHEAHADFSKIIADSISLTVSP
jgi:hypothetical protein